MSSEIRRLRTLDEAVTDACAWLQVDRGSFFDLALAWPEHRDRLWSQGSPEQFYLAWQGEAGRSNLCANILDQFQRERVWLAYDAVFNQTKVDFFLDYGCGSAALCHPFLAGCTSAVLTDVPNLIQQFVRWRLERHGLDNVAVLTIDEAAALPDETFDFIACVDVLEHLPEPTRVLLELERMLKPEGLLLHRSPWARPDEDLCEHLPEATADWHRPGGGAARLAERYEIVAQVEFGGLYRLLG